MLGMEQALESSQVKLCVSLGDIIIIGNILKCLITNLKQILE